MLDAQVEIAQYEYRKGLWDRRYEPNPPEYDPKVAPGLTEAELEEKVQAEEKALQHSSEAVDIIHPEGDQK